MSAPAPGVERRHGGTRRDAPAAPGLAARRVAGALLQGVLDNGRTLDDLLTETAGFGALPPRDRAFARLLVGTALRRLGQIDAIVGAFLDRPLPARAAAARTLLQVGAAQILFLGTPAYAAVANAVALAGETNATRPYKGLVNAVLRKLDSAGRSLLDKQDAPLLNTPDWLWRSWIETYGEPAARAIAAAHLDEPPLDLTLRPDADAAEWAARLNAQVLPTGTLRCAAGGRIEDLSGFDEGVWWIQDAAAALPARLIPNPSNRLVFDLCAAPGGKTAQLAAAGAEVVAVDRVESRLDRLRENLARLSLSAECVAADAVEWRPGRRADAILLDAPCSATGTLRRHPDVARRKRAADLTALTAAQDRLLDAGARLLAPGGVLVYCVCSLQPEEGLARVDALLARNPGFRRMPVRPGEIGDRPEFINEDGDLRTLPSHLTDCGGLDGFYACRLTRD
jgi:16S rRNA (cytosine967-C5)-methyltransferase